MDVDLPAGMPADLRALLLRRERGELDHRGFSVVMVERLWARRGEMRAVRMPPAPTDAGDPEQGRIHRDRCRTAQAKNYSLLGDLWEGSLLLPALPWRALAAEVFGPRALLRLDEWDARHERGACAFPPSDPESLWPGRTVVLWTCMRCRWAAA